MNAIDRPAPPWQVDRWFNTPHAITLESLRGKVVVLEAFQMLCPGCVSHGLPQATRIHATFPHDQVAVVGLHTVFEHHAAMTPIALEAFLHEYRIAFPVGVDPPGTHGPIPRTMEAYAMRGTPTLILIDAQGRLRHQHFGQVSDLVLGAQIATLVHEAQAIAVSEETQIPPQAATGCATDGCAIPV
ncbi:redoxin domain-containing protein [Pseudoxanthomonas sp. PXM02]|uniref:redoxin domain-containing protein n=1 Tax=Pseudoxanthomonas sp. PXM02 TaxID=2769294 RepID=UPI001782F341|nr:redoxin domain-containing protein [Pseudoxanthomonas sp. PXM02]MBD9478212.1 redoxin domain-containing protein [Pseudoxanthomonas sp. PXM02]